jgi:hypothetical protein
LLPLLVATILTSYAEKSQELILKLIGWWWDFGGGGGQFKARGCEIG